MRPSVLPPAVGASLYKFLRFARSCSTVVKGRATIEGTKSFVNKSNQLKLFHQFHLSKLFITPIIHGSPNEEYDQQLNDLMMEKAIVENRSNCVIVYHCKDPIPTDSKTKPPPIIWGTDSLSKIILNPSHGLSREEFVVGANLGYAVTTQQIHTRYAEALKMSNLEYLDFVIVEVCDAVLDSLGDRQVFEIGETLQKLCQENKLHFLAAKASLAPFIYHTPPFRKYGKYMTAPLSFETEMEGDDYSVDLVIYPISPSISVPSSYPMLDANPESVDLAEVEVNGDDLKRTITRAACDPFTCYRGLGGSNANHESADKEMEEIAKRSDDDSKPSGVPLHAMDPQGESPWYLVDGLIPPPVDGLISSALDELCPQLVSTPLLQEKALRCVFSVGVEVMLVDAELSATIGPLKLKPDQLLSSHDTEDVFLYFSMPDMNNLSDEGEGNDDGGVEEDGEGEGEEDEEDEDEGAKRRR